MLISIVLTILLLRFSTTLFFLSIEKIYQTLETVFHRLFKHIEFRPKYIAARRIFNSVLGVLDIPKKHCLACLIHYFEFIILLLNILPILNERINLSFRIIRIATIGCPALCQVDFSVYAKGFDVNFKVQQGSQ